jgi:endonuclease YncB( thermonuclease family)
LRSRRGISAIIVVVLFLLGLVNADLRNQVAEALNLPTISDPNKPLPSKTKAPLEEGIWDVVHVVDGDTIDVSDSSDKSKKYRIRFIGMDTPETKHPTKPVEPFGPEASDFTKRKIAEANNQVRLAFDGDQIDKYGRTLAMVYLPMPDGSEIWLNELLLREGLARAQLQYRFSKGAKEKFRLAEEEAKAAKRNLWSLPCH